MKKTFCANKSLFVKKSFCVNKSLFVKKSFFVKKIFLYCLCLSFFYTLPVNVNAAISQNLEREWKANQKIIRTLKKELAAKSKEEEKQTKELGLIETKLGELSRSLKEIKQSILATETELQQVQNTRKNLLQTLEKKRTQLKQQLKACYLFKKNNPLKILLSQKNIYSIDRLLHYYRILEDHHYRILNTMLAEIDNLTKQQNEIDQLRLRLNAFKEEEETLCSQILAQKKNREKTLATLKKDIVSKYEALKRAEDNERELEIQLNNMEHALNNE